MPACSPSLRNLKSETRIDVVLARLPHGHARSSKQDPCPAEARTGARKSGPGVTRRVGSRPFDCRGLARWRLRVGAGTDKPPGRGARTGSGGEGGIRTPEAL